MGSREKEIKEKLKIGNNQNRCGTERQ